jgi:hypothetical protein
VGRVTAALWTDVDQDGWPDLLVALDWGPIKYFHNNGGRAFEDWTERAGFASAGTGWWKSLASADFNGDGRPDFVAGNLGLNTPYHASAERPALLLSGRFAEAGDQTLIEAYYEGDRLFPWATRRELGGKIPSVLKRFPRNDQYARATLGEILGEDRLAAAQRYLATEFRSGVFLSQADGTYRFAPLPRLAQIAPLQAVVAGDFDGDGHADIYALQNSYTPDPQLGRFDGGLSQLLRGDGQGHFTAVPPAESGLVMPDETAALSLIDLDGDGWPDFLITRSHAPAVVYRNRGILGRHSLRVDLRGPVGNPGAVGAHVVLEMSDGTTQSADVIAAAISTSTPSPGCFFGFSNANSPRRIHVRWPDGSSSTQEVASAATATVLTVPAK